MEIYREDSQYNNSKLVWLWLAVLVLSVWLCKEVDSILAGRFSFTGSAYIVLFSGLLAWRYAVRYTYSLTKDQIIIKSHFLWFTRTFIVDLDLVESCSSQYVKSKFRRCGIKRYVHRYSSGDANPTRIILFNRKGERQALLIKVGDNFLDELSDLIPIKCQ
ncbi:MAG: hypothetical protein GX348_05255 [Veillonellaceae bacterium]|jgi:hypothetical protein|nr:hypothetical protein [Veillonellaceae bacterium]